MIVYCGITLELSRRAVKTLRLTVYPDCRVLLVVPHAARTEEVYSFLDAKKLWIEKQLAKYRTQKQKKQPAFVSGEICYVWGVPHRLELIERRGHPKMVCADMRGVTGQRPVEGVVRYQALQGRVPDEGEASPSLFMYVRPGSTMTQKQALWTNGARRLYRRRFLRWWRNGGGRLLPGQNGLVLWWKKCTYKR